MAGLEDHSLNEGILQQMVDIILGNVYIAHVEQEVSGTLSVSLYDTSTDVDLNINQLLLETLRDAELVAKLPEVSWPTSWLYTHFSFSLFRPPSLEVKSNGH